MADNGIGCATGMVEELVVEILCALDIVECKVFALARSTLSPDVGRGVFVL